MQRKTKIILISVSVIVALSLVIIILCHNKKTVVANLSPTLVALSPVTTVDIPLIASATGNSTANQQTDISPKVAGYISKILFKEGDYVKAGTLLIQLDDTKEQNDLAAAQADAALSQLQFEHDNKAYKKGLILQDQVYNTKVTNEKNQAQLKQAQTAVADMALTAPFSGYVGSKNISLGDYVTPGQKLVTLVDQQDLKVSYALPSRFAPQVQVGQIVHVTSHFLPDKTFSAKVTFVSPYIDVDSQTIALHAVLNNENGALKPGQFVNVTQTLGIISHAILVPENSIVTTMNDYRVFTVKNDHVVAIPVKTGEHLFGKVQIISGLTANDKIITVGQDQVKDGDLVKVVTQ